MLEGSHGMARDADGAVVVLQQQVDEHHDAQAMWLLGLCCEYGRGTEQDTQRAEQLFQQAAQQGDETAKLLVDQLRNSSGRGCLDMVWGCEQTRHITPLLLLLNNQHTIDVPFVCHNNHRETHWTGWCGFAGSDAADARAADNAEPGR